MISFGLTEDQRMVQETVRKFAEDEVRPVHRECEKSGVPAPLAKKFGELSLSLIDVPEAMGGMGLGTLTGVLVHEELAWGDPGAAVALWSPHFAAQAIQELADDEAQARRLLGRFAEGARGAVAWADAGAGGALPEAGFAATARKGGDGWILDGDKGPIVNGGVADVYVVFAQIDASAGWGGVGAFVVDGKDPGVKTGAKAEWVGLETVPAARVRFEGCRVSEADRLGRAASVEHLRRFFARCALVSAARQVGLARASYEHALAYTQDRSAFGKPVAHFQSISFTLAEMHMDVEAARWMVWRAATEVDAGSPDAEVSVALAATHANEAAWRVADNGVQLLGGAGYIQDFPAEKWMRDTRALSLLGFSDQLGQLVIAGHVLGRDGEFGTGLPESWIQPVVT
jgi:alkylation response protein AidB-like acyl-CoA dehydrogenase